MVLFLVHRFGEYEHENVARFHVLPRELLFAIVAEVVSGTAILQFQPELNTSNDQYFDIFQEDE